MTDEALLANLATAYNRAAAQRNEAAVDEWKAVERSAFLARLRDEGRTSLLEVGSGPGVHGKWFADNGMTVTCTDLSPEHVRLCREKGLEAFVAPFLEMDFGGRTFDAAFALNCLLHVPPADLPRALGRIRAAIAPGGLFFLGQYGGDTSDGIDEGDSYEPKRYFSFLSDGDLQRAVGDAGFAIIEFHSVDVGSERLHFQSLALRR